MRLKSALLIVTGVLALPIYSALASLVDTPVNSTKAEKHQGAEYAASLRHTHRHCHITVTLGHAKKRCHTHRHNKIVHHGARYH